MDSITKQRLLKNNAYWFIAPAIFFYLMFWFFPVMLSFLQAFTTLQGEFTFSNFRLMFDDPLFNNALRNTLVFALVSLFLQFFLALGLALLAHKTFKGSKLFLFILLIPMALPQSAVGIIWNNGLMEFGWINSLLETSGLQGLLTSLGVSPSLRIWKNMTGLQAVMLIILIDTWTVLPSVMIIILAGLQNFNKEFKEAAQVFGSTRFQALRHVVIPIIKPSIVTALLLRLISGLQIWLISVMIFGYNRVPYLLERIVFYSDVVRMSENSYKIAVTYSVFTLTLVFVIALLFVRATKGREWRNANE
jgi:multiple sugar transport system permease protein